MVGGCVEAPRPSGRKQTTKPLKASIMLKQGLTDAVDLVKWKWTTGEATTFAELGNPPLPAQWAAKSLGSRELRFNNTARNDS
jgi:hypothetical protein